MNHIDEGDLQAYLDAELKLPERREVERHLDGCHRCGAALAALRRMAGTFSAGVGLIDPTAVRPRSPAAAGSATGQRVRGVSVGARRILPRAAVLFLFLGAAASATVPGSPVRRWIADLAPTPPTAEAPAPALESSPPPAAPREAGVYVEPVDGAVEVVVNGARELRVRAVVVDGTRAGVTGSGGAAASRFRTGAGMIEVREAAGGELRVEVPRATPVATIMINGEVVLRKADGRLDLSAGAPALEAAEITFSVEQ